MHRNVQVKRDERPVQPHELIAILRASVLVPSSRVNRQPTNIIYISKISNGFWIVVARGGDWCGGQEWDTSPSNTQRW